MTPSEKIARFIAETDTAGLSDEIVERVTGAVMDTVGVTMAGLADPSAVKVRRFVERMGGHPQARVFGAGFKTSTIMAALANGTAAHALDYDDTNQVIMSHPSIQMLPGLLALAEHLGANGRAVIEAYVIGFEVGAKLGRAINPNLVFQGWFPVGVLGTVMQAAACARLLGLDVEQARMAVGIAANMAAGLRCNNGTMAKPLVAGSLALGGIQAALLAQDGFTANPNAVEDKLGYFENFSRGDGKLLEKAVEELGREPLEIILSGISQKLYPCCAGAHMPIDGVLEIVASHPLDPADIEEVQVSVQERMKFLLIHPDPKTENQAKFSLEYCVSRAILDGEMGLEQFTPSKINDPKVKPLLKIVRTSYFEAPPPSSREPSPLVKVLVKTKSGQVFSTEIEHARGTVQNPLSPEMRRKKFYQCMSRVLPDRKIAAIEKELAGFAALEDVGGLARLLDIET